MCGQSQETQECENVSQRIKQNTEISTHRENWEVPSDRGTVYKMCLQEWAHLAAGSLWGLGRFKARHLFSQWGSCLGSTLCTDEIRFCRNWNAEGVALLHGCFCAWKRAGMALGKGGEKPCTGVKRCWLWEHWGWEELQNSSSRCPENILFLSKSFYISWVSHPEMVPSVSYSPVPQKQHLRPLWEDYMAKNKIGKVMESNTTVT